MSRDADTETVRRLALDVAAESVGEKAVVGCFLTKVDASAITLELRLQAPDVAARDQLRSKMLSALSQRFTEQKIGTSGTDLPAFS